MTTAYEPGRTAYEARFAGEKQGPRGTVDPWEMLCPSAKAIWARAEKEIESAYALRLSAARRGRAFLNQRSDARV